MTLIMRNFRNLLVASKEFTPDLLVYNAGTDILVGDCLGGLSLSEEVSN